MSEVLTLYVPDVFVSETRKIDFIYRHKGTAAALNEAIKQLIAMSPVPEDYNDMHEYSLACNTNEARLNTLRTMVVEIEATWMLANRVVPAGND